jgi:hypothetical protein
MYPTYQGKPNIILIAFVVLCSLVVITIFYLILKTSPTSSSSSNNGTLNQLSPVEVSNKLNQPSPSRTVVPMPSTSKGAPIGNQFEVPSTGVSEVFHISNNIFSKADAPAVCKLYGAEVANLEQLKEAHSKGADWCSGGWTKEGLVAYPIQQSTYDKLQENDPQNRNVCGLPGINLLRNEEDLLYGVNCFGVKRKARGVEKLKQNIMSDKDIDIQKRMAQIRQLDINLSPWSSDKWSAY